MYDRQQKRRLCDLTQLDLGICGGPALILEPQQGIQVQAAILALLLLLLLALPVGPARGPIMFLNTRGSGAKEQGSAPSQRIFQSDPVR